MNWNIVDSINMLFVVFVICCKHIATSCFLFPVTFIRAIENVSVSCLQSHIQAMIRGFVQTLDCPRFSNLSWTVLNPFVFIWDHVRVFFVNSQISTFLNLYSFDKANASIVFVFLAFFLSQFVPFLVTMRTAIVVTFLVMTIADVNTRTKQLSCSKGRSFTATEGIHSTLYILFSKLFTLRSWKNLLFLLKISASLRLWATHV